MGLFGSSNKGLNVRRVTGEMEAFFRKECGIRDVKVNPLNNGAAQIVANAALFGYDTLYCGVCIFPSGYMAVAIDFDSNLTSAPADLYVACNEFNNEVAGWKAYFEAPDKAGETGSIDFANEVETVDDETAMQNLRHMFNRILDDDTKKLITPMMRYFN